ncbi:unnamed protein product [Ilex paraguariensis]|uniref:Uncharacterized protein n=1 Tax=Ilex paraguariensis TaxID=185542 RepID=A0ABC8UVH9_9AQUA
MGDKIFADMDELGIRPTVLIVTMVGDVFQKLGMLDKYEKLKKKYPPPKWEYRYIKGKCVKIRSKYLNEPSKGLNKFDDQAGNKYCELLKNAQLHSDEINDVDEYKVVEVCSAEVGETIIL